MAKSILIEDNVDSIIMPDNLKVGLMVSRHRNNCKKIECNFDYYGLAFGQSPFFVPDIIAKALGDNAKKAHYSAAEGIGELRVAIRGFNKRHFGLDIPTNRIIVGPGTKELIHNIFSIVKGDVILPSPSWIGYAPQIRLLDKKFHTFYLKPENDYKINSDDLDEFLKNLGENQKIIVLNNPHNPTGIVYRKEELVAIADVCKKNNTLVLADEIYALTTYDIENFTSMGAIYPEGTFVTNGLSKDRSAGGYRLGACILPTNSTDQLFSDFQKVAATVYTNVTTPIQYASITAYNPSEEIEQYFNITRNIHRIMCQTISQEFNKIYGIKASMPYGGFYFFADFNELRDDLIKNGISTSNQLAESLLSHPYHIAVVTGDACMLKPDNFGARIACVDYDGKKVYEDYKKNPPKKDEELDFVRRNAPKMIDAVTALKRYVQDLKDKNKYGDE